MIPENVLFILANIADVVANSSMLFSNQRATLALVQAADSDAADWLRLNPSRYREAINSATGQGDNENE